MAAKVGLVAVAALASLVALAVPKYQYLGIGKVVPAINNDRCVTIPELVGCEQAYVHHDSGVAYLGCSSLAHRGAWTPAVLHLNATALPSKSADTLWTYDFNTGTTHQLKLTQTPADFPGVFNHGFDAFPSPSNPQQLTFFFVSHRPPADRSKAHETGADSVIEVFETELGSNELRWKKTVRDVAVRTPNSIAATSPTSFYVTNDHARKVHWSRAYEILRAETTDIAFCDVSGAGHRCSVAVDGIYYNNGIARAPSGRIFSGSTITGKITHWEAQSDGSLILLDEIPLGSAIDNVHAAPTGDVYAVTFPRLLDLVASHSPEAIHLDLKSPVQAWKVSAETSEKQYLGAKFKKELIFSDDGERVSGATSAAPYQNKLLLTGLMSKFVAVCTVA